MNEEPSNAPLSASPADSAGFAGWISTWMTAVTKPNEQTYAMLAEHPDAMSNNRAFLWVFLAGTISALISGVLQAILELAGFPSPYTSFGELFGGGSAQGGMLSLGIAICISPIAGAIATLFFAIGVGIVQWLAKMFKGTGTFSQLAYTMAAVFVPFTLVSSVLTPFSAIQVLSLCLLPINILLLLYVTVLNVMAVKVVNKIGLVEAAGSVLLPWLVLVCCVVVVAIAGMAALGSRVNDTFNSINQTLTP